MSCTLHNLLTSCQYPQVFWVYKQNDYDQNILIAKGTKQEMLEDEEMGFDIIDHINDEVEYWTIRQDGAMFVRLKWDKKAEDEYSDEYVKSWGRNPHSRPWLYSAELDDFMDDIHGSSEYIHPYGDPSECHNWGERWEAERKKEREAE